MKPLRIALVAVVQASLITLAVAPQISARVAGEEYRFRVEPVDPIDPFRGAYVTLAYPDLRHDDSTDGDGGLGSLEDGDPGSVYVTLSRKGEVWVASEFTRTRPSSGPYLACNDRDWQIECGIHSYFLPQDKAAEMEAQLREGAIATVRIDSRGNAALISVTAD